MGSNPVSAVTRGLGDVATFGTNELAGNPIGNGTNKLLGGTGGLGTGSIYGSMFGGTNNPYVSGPFSLDPNQVSGDQSVINNLGSTQQNQINQLAQQQYDQTTKQIPTTVANEIQQENPAIMESLNSGGLLTSSAYPQEIARQQSILTQGLEMPAIQGLQQAQQGGLGVAQSAGTAAAQRGMSLEDFINQANVSKTIGASMAPAAPSSKAQAGTTMQGVGALAPFAKLGKGAAAAAPAAGLV